MTSDELNQRELDSLLERRIEGERLAMTDAPDAINRGIHFYRMAELIAQRSPEQVAKMELERGLRAP